MEELYLRMGFRENPFSKYSAEEEKAYLSKIYEKPRYYESLLSEICEGNSRYLFGERGIGKSALMYYLMSDLKSKGVFVMLLDEFDGIQIKNNESQLLCLIEKRIITALGIELICDKKKIRNLDKYEREKLSFLLSVFFETLGKSRFKELYEEVSRTKGKNILRNIYNNFFVKTVNTILSGASNVVGSTICKALGLPSIDTAVVYQEFLTESKEVKQDIVCDKIDYGTLKNILRETAKIINKIGFQKLVIFLDKIDEYQKLKSKTDSIADFLEMVATDTSLIYSEEFGIEFVLWGKLKEKLKEKQVRFDKSKPIDISWSDDELKKIIERRLQYFSDDKIQTLNQILSDESVENIIQMAQGSPRQIIMLLSRIYEEQSKMDAQVKRFSEHAIEEGTKVFCQCFEYQLFYPNSEIKQSIDRILMMNKNEFEITNLASVTKKSAVTAGNWVRTMISYGLVEEIEGNNGRAKLYSVIDPKLIFLINNKLGYIG